MKTIYRAFSILREEGLLELLSKTIDYWHRTAQPYLPECTGVYNGVAVSVPLSIRKILSGESHDVPGYEEALVRGIRNEVNRGDDVVIVGGGLGVSTVVAACQTGKTGSVITYEGSDEAISNVYDAIRRNKVDDWVTVRHAVVSRAVSLRGDRGSAKSISPVDLPECDVLVLDCEGVEVDILQEMKIKPKNIIVETHGLFGADTGSVTEILDSRGYKISDKRLAEPRLKEECEENDIRVLSSHL